MKMTQDAEMRMSMMRLKANYHDKPVGLGEALAGEDFL